MINGKKVLEEKFYEDVKTNFKVPQNENAQMAVSLILLGWSKEKGFVWQDKIAKYENVVYDNKIPIKDFIKQILDRWITDWVRIVNKIPDSITDKVDDIAWEVYIQGKNVCEHTLEWHSDIDEFFCNR